MKFSTNFFRSVFLAVVCATTATAAPFVGSLKHTTLQVREISPGLVVESFHPESTLEVRSRSATFVLMVTLMVHCADIWCERRRPPALCA